MIMIDYFKYVKTKIFEKIYYFKDVILNLKDNNIIVSYKFLNEGYLFKAFIRLKTILFLWPNNDEAKYLLCIIYMLNGNVKRSIFYLNSVKNYDDKFINKEKLINFLNKNVDFKLINDVYYDNFSLFLVKKYIEDFNE